MKSKVSLNLIMSSSALYPFLIGLYPVAFLVSKNWFVYETSQLLFLLIVPIIIGSIGLVVIGAYKIMRSILLKTLPDRYKTIFYRFFDKYGLARVLLSLLGIYVTYFLLAASIPKSKSMYFVFAVAVCIVCVLVSKFRFYFVNIALSVMITMAAVELIYSLSTKPLESQILIQSVNKEADSQIRFKRTPNIYLVHLESYQSPQAMKELYGIDNNNFDTELAKKGFFVSQSNFSNYSSSLTSVGSMFLQQHHYYKISTGLEDALGLRDLIGGRLYNPVLAILKSNGYKISYLHKDSYLFMGSDNLDYYYPRNSVHDSLMIFQNEKIDQLRAKVFNLKKPERKDYIPGDKDEFTSVLWGQLQKEVASSQPYFFYIKDEALVHSPSDGSYSWKTSDVDWVSSYKKIVERDSPQILKLVLNITDLDPNGIIILYGDHGAWRYRNIWTGLKKGEDINKIIYERRRITGEDLALDVFGTFLAVRYPGGDNKLLDGETHVNIFRKLFSDLSQNPSLMDNAPANSSYIKANSKQLYLLVKDGKALKNIEVVDIPK